VLGKIFGAKGDEVPGVVRRLHKEELCDLYCSQNIMQLMKSRGLNGRVMWHLWSKREVYTGFRCGDLRERNHLEDPGVDGRIIS
jgi:hypothetical protein